MKEMNFEITNEQRKYLGLTFIEDNWELVKLFDNYFYFNGDIICKQITVEPDGYTERDINELTTENRTLVLPKTNKGKPKKLNFTTIQSFRGNGIYFSFSNTYLTISNYTTQKTFYSESYENKKLDYLKIWLEKWISESTEEDLQEIEIFKSEKRKQCKYKEGDFFAFKISRRQWGFGRILLDVPKRIKIDKLKENKNYGLTHLMGKCLIVKVYHKTSENFNINFEELSDTLALPSQAVMDNHIFYGENPIIGNLPLKMSELDMLISYSKSISTDDKRTVYLQYGLIYEETDISKFDKFLIAKDINSYSGYEENPYRKESTGYSLDIQELMRCIDEKSNKPYWESSEIYDVKFDLRNPNNLEIKREIFRTFGLDADKNYEENMKIASR